MACFLLVQPCYLLDTAEISTFLQPALPPWAGVACRARRSGGRFLNLHNEMSSESKVSTSC